jgi:hypothetical protein
LLGLFQKMQRQVLGLVPLKTTGLRNLLDANNAGYIWREHCRLFPKSRMRRWLTILSAGTVTVIVISIILGEAGP